MKQRVPSASENIIQDNPIITFTNHDGYGQAHMHPYNQRHGREHHHGDHAHDHDRDGEDDHDHAHYFLLHQTSSVCGLGWALAQLSSQSLVATRQTEKFFQLSQLLHRPEIAAN